MVGAMKASLLCSLCLALTCLCAAQPVPPHAVYGEITQEGEGVSDSAVAAVYEGSELASTQSGENGDYLLEIPHDSSYTGEEISLEVDSDATGLSVTFESGGSSRRDLEIGGQPHLVTGYVKNPDGEGINGVEVAFLDGGTETGSDSTDSEGFYSVQIPFSTDYQGQNLDMSTDEEATGKEVEFVSGGETQLNHTRESAEDTAESSDEEDDDQQQASVGGSQQEGSGEQSSGSEENEDTEQATADPSQQSATNTGSGSGGSGSLSVDGLEAPSTVNAGSAFEVEVSFKNSGSAERNISKELLVNGEERATLKVEVPPGLSVSTAREITINQEGSYTVSVGEKSSEVNVNPRTGQPSSGNGGTGSLPLPILGLGVSALLFVSAGVYIVYSRTGGREKSDSGSEPAQDSGDPRTQSHDNNLSYTDEDE